MNTNRSKKQTSENIRKSSCIALIFLLVLLFLVSVDNAVQEVNNGNNSKDDEEGIHSNYA